MPRDFQAFVDEIERSRKLKKRQGAGNSVYGSRVMPVLELYAGLVEFEERDAFQKALEMLLSDADPERRSFAVDICLGFFVFRDAIRVDRAR